MDEVIKDGTDMTIGVDLGDKWSRLCVLDEHGEVCEEGRIVTSADAMRKRFSTEAPCRIVLEVGTRSPWAWKEYEECSTVRGVWTPPWTPGSSVPFRCQTDHSIRSSVANRR